MWRTSRSSTERGQIIRARARRFSGFSVLLLVPGLLAPKGCYFGAADVSLGANADSTGSAGEPTNSLEPVAGWGQGGEFGWEAGAPGQAAGGASVTNSAGGTTSAGSTSGGVSSGGTFVVVRGVRSPQ